jgi:hypothetical protein
MQEAHTDKILSQVNPLGKVGDKSISTTSDLGHQVDSQNFYNTSGLFVSPSPVIDSREDALDALDKSKEEFV